MSLDRLRRIIEATEEDANVEEGMECREDLRRECEERIRRVSIKE